MKKILALIFLITLAFACKNSSTQQQNIPVTPNKMITLQVNGMTCTGCEQTIQEAVMKIKGVSEVKASHLDSLVVVSYDSAATGPEAFGQAINEVGYEYVGIR